MLSVQEMLPDIITEDCEMWLKSIGFYDKPASIHHHGANNGDLYLHCVEVARALCGLSEKLGLVWQRKESPMLVGLLHDVCKCDDYISDGWEDDHEIWKYNESKTMGGHGDKSVIMLSGHMQLTEEEMYCIRFHMGAFTDKEEWKYYSKAVNKYPNVLYTHTADMIASQINNI